MPGDADAVGVDHAESHRLVDSGLGVGDELLEVSVVGLLGIADDRERRVVDDGVTGEQEQSYSRSRVKVSCGAGDLAGRRGLGVVERIGVENRGDARALLVAGRRVERERQVEAVLALVLDEALLDGAHRGRRVGHVGHGYGWSKRRWLRRQARRRMVRACASTRSADRSATGAR